MDMKVQTIRKNLITLGLSMMMFGLGSQSIQAKAGIQGKLFNVSPYHLIIDCNGVSQIAEITPSSSGSAHYVDEFYLLEEEMVAVIQLNANYGKADLGLNVLTVAAFSATGEFLGRASYGGSSTSFIDYEKTFGLRLFVDSVSDPLLQCSFRVNKN